MSESIETGSSFSLLGASVFVLTFALGRSLLFELMGAAFSLIFLLLNDYKVSYKSKGSSVSNFSVSKFSSASNLRSVNRFLSW